MTVRNIYLKIETIEDYSPVSPDEDVSPPIVYERDCMRNTGHENTTIPRDEVNARRLTALVYRRYLDPGFLVPKPDRLILADINEPAFDRRVPGAVIYALPGTRLCIHVKNADTAPHSFHLHGLKCGIDSDGAWPFGTQSSDGRRSDEICPGEIWTYTFNVTDEMIGAWPFHDHYRDIEANVNRGLFGGLIVLPGDERDDLPRFPLPTDLEELIKGGLAPVRPDGVMAPIRRRDDDDVPEALMAHLAVLDENVRASQIPLIPKPPQPLYVPLFFHVMSGPRETPVFQSTPLNPPVRRRRGGTFTSPVFSFPAVYNYFCGIHGREMAGIINVKPEGPGVVSVTIVDNQFIPATVTVGVGGKVIWTNNGPSVHSVVERGGDSLPSFCFNGRSFVGNTPTILAAAGQRIKWYVFNLDLGINWHNFHPHGQRWRFAQETIDTRSLGPAESFVAETTAPPVFLLPDEIKEYQDPDRRPADAKPFCLRGDFLFQCHSERDMVHGLAGLVRSMQTVWLTPEDAAKLEAEKGLPLDPGDNSCPAVDFEHCANAITGKIEELSGLPEITFMHAVLLPKTERVLFWGYGPRTDQSRVWDQATGIYSQPANQPQSVTPDENLWSGAHAFLNDAAGTILALGGYFFPPAPPVTADTERRAYLFDPPSLTWSHATDLNVRRFYPTSLTLSDGRVLALFGQNTSSGTPSASLETFTPGGAGSWSAPKAVPFNYFYYPWTFLLPNGDLFVAGPQKPARRFDPAAAVIVDDPAKQFNQVFPQRGVNMDGTAVLLPLRPPGYAPRVLIAGGNGAATQQSVEWIDLSAATPTWQALPNMNVARDKLNSVLLPDGQVLIVGGTLPLAPPDGGPVELFDPEDPSAGFELGPVMKFQRGYHSAAILLADGSVVIGGDPNGGATPNERYLPPYFFKARPTITSAPATVGYGANFTVNTPQAAGISEVVLMRPGAVTHAFNQSQRYVGCVIVLASGSSVQATAPLNRNVAPPGYYLLFVVDADRVPSRGVWIRVG
jgi:plastocyanin